MLARQPASGIARLRAGDAFESSHACCPAMLTFTHVVEIDATAVE